MKKLLVVVDMQNDFLTGSLANPEAVKCIPVIKDAIKDYDYVVFTQDTHYKSYLSTLEGKNLPIEHCIVGTDGHKVNSELLEEVKKLNKSFQFASKITFGANWDDVSTDGNYFDEVTFCGTCTDICVVSCVVTFKSAYPEVPIKVMSSGCAGTTKENHEAALQVLKSIQVEII